MKSAFNKLSERDVDRIIEMAWEDRTPFEAIEIQFKLSEQDVIKLMRRELKSSSWRLWRERAHQVSHKHLKKRNNEMDRFRCTQQRQITLNKISKR
ncbi:MAG: TIGR03643 family protein [Bacteroidetes bacterium]|nr:TIGR03643 family protein [Bacteroidota bacterium]MBU1371521.1 TIGR03643 family protein [Bacteroidota bacterium]MBU1485140.1 TIGR03643 family protein [Bacteroidota bacterium]MBU1760359.1 TIGR03643 family protein [Bacteroidota bacterium]MBU2046719.1 TIGR03643 family protein [Bacteroidota bacterium]